MTRGAADGASQFDELKRKGKHYTPPELADFVASEIAACLQPLDKHRTLRVLDPALGDGSLLEAMGRQLARCDLTNFELTGLDTDAAAVESASHRLEAQFPARAVRLCVADFLNGPPSGDGYDIVIANPPYVRTQVLGAGVSQELARKFRLQGRVDLSHAFLRTLAGTLHVGGCAGLIVSNRIFTTQTGAGVREALLDALEVVSAWDLGDTRLFGATVLPALLFLRKPAGEETPAGTPRFSSIYQISAAEDAAACPGLMDALCREGNVRLPDGRHFRVRHGRLAIGAEPGHVWTFSSPGVDRWLQTADAHTALRFGDLGHLRVGVKTTADRVFIRADWDELPPEERPELLRPLLTHHDARRFRAAPGPPRRQILYPHASVDGQRTLLDLASYPATRRYLESHREVLERRVYVREAKRAWYEIWVPHHPGAWQAPKLVFRDISLGPVCWRDESGAVVNGDCYWLSLGDCDAELGWLALGVANSRFIEHYYDFRFHNKLYAGRRRFITQYVERFPLPAPDGGDAAEIVRLARRIYSLGALGTEALEAELDAAVWRAFGFPDGENHGLSPAGEDE